MLIVNVPLRLGTGQNNREHHMARHRRVKAEREAVSWVLVGKPRPPLPCVVRNGMDDDGCVSALKSVRDEIASWIGVDDGRADLVTYTAHQERGQRGVRIEVETRTT
jgi:hypothetical protein